MHNELASVVWRERDGILSSTGVMWNYIIQSNLFLLLTVQYNAV